MVADDQIQKALPSATTPKQKVDQLIEMALSGGAKDNVTVVIVNIR
jgi:serine/threonine protein phosphatase PrpC